MGQTGKNRSNLVNDTQFFLIDYYRINCDIFLYRLVVQFCLELMRKTKAETVIGD